MNLEEQQEQRDAIILQYQHLVQKIAATLMRRFSLPAQIKDELISAGFLGLVEAVAKADPREDSLGAYIQIRVRGSMIDMLRNSSVLSRKSHRFIKTMSAIQNLQEEDAIEQSAFAASQTVQQEKMSHALNMLSKGALAFRLSDKDEEACFATLESAIEPADARIHRKQKRKKLLTLIEKLPNKEQIIIKGYYFEDKPFVQIVAENEGMTKSWVSRLHTRALERLREQLDENAAT